MLKAVSSITNAIGALNYKGTWNASTNTPTLASSVGTKGDYYVVSVAGSTTLDGISNWGVGDWAAYNGSVWQRVEGGADGNFVNLSVSSTSTLSVATATTVNKVTLTAPATAATLTIAEGKTLTASNTLTLAGTDATTMTFPATSATIARTDAANTFTGVQTMTSPALTTPAITGAATFSSYIVLGGTSGINDYGAINIPTGEKLILNSYHGLDLKTSGGTGSGTPILVFSIASNGNVTNTNNSYGAISDSKLKENITATTPKLAQLNRVRIVNYNLRAYPTHKQLGVIAQELEAIFPGMVEEYPDYEHQTKTREVEVPAAEEVKDKDGNVIIEASPASTRIEEYIEQVALGTVTKSVKYSVFVPMLIKAMQEQQVMLESLTTRISALESK
jgi:hypothetical protein